MIVTFCGHAQFCRTPNLERQMQMILEREVGFENTEFYLGGYGEFDAFAYDCCKRYQEYYKGVSLVYVTPYVTEAYQKNHLSVIEKQYDTVLYPGIEDKPLRYAISYRNRYMIEKADLVIAYVSHEWGGAYKSYRYAIRKGNRVINLSGE